MLAPARIPIVEGLARSESLYRLGHRRCTNFTYAISRTALLRPCFEILLTPPPPPFLHPGDFISKFATRFSESLQVTFKILTFHGGF
jgi:hypothetical protein